MENNTSIVPVLPENPVHDELDWYFYIDLVLLSITLLSILVFLFNICVLENLAKCLKRERRLDTCRCRYDIVDSQ